jgi:hypothetical protein
VNTHKPSEPPPLQLNLFLYLSHVSYFIQLTPLETHLVIADSFKHYSFVIPNTSVHSLGLHDYVPVVVPVVVPAG